MIRNDIDTVMDRTVRFNTGEKVGEALIMVDIPFEGYKVPELNRWEFPDQLYKYLDRRLEYYDCYWEYSKDIEDDRIPNVCPWFGFAEHAAFIGGDVDFSESTSWVHPIIKKWEDISRLELSENNIWLRMIVDGLSYLKEKVSEKYTLSLRGVMAPMDIANAIRGNEIFTDFFEYPDKLHELLEFCTQACEWFISHQKAVVGELNGGTLVGTGLWLPGDSIGHLSEDASVMCSPGLYQEFGKPYTEKFVRKYDHAFIHLHGAGTHVFPDILKINKMDYIEITNDPNQPRSIQIYRQLWDLFEKKAVKLFVTLDEIKENIELLKKGKTVLICEVNSLDEAESAVKYVRRELAVQ